MIFVVCVCFSAVLHSASRHGVVVMAVVDAPSVGTIEGVASIMAVRVEVEVRTGLVGGDVHKVAHDTMRSVIYYAIEPDPILVPHSIGGGLKISACRRRRAAKFKELLFLAARVGTPTSF